MNYEHWSAHEIVNMLNTRFATEAALKDGVPIRLLWLPAGGGLDGWMFYRPNLFTQSPFVLIYNRPMMDLAYPNGIVATSDTYINSVGSNIGVNIENQKWVFKDEL